ncbi:MAG: glutamate-1-semialdehyde 2,1-aminomutase [Deltaproteobacteria bacterium]|nr:glutamate-1-semialdehyde 2,1-aminomutase [Deltaproteobacteria bacterium]
MMKNCYSEACEYLVGGVNSPVRAFRAMGREPIFVARAKGPYVWDTESRRYIDLIGSWGPMILGHAHPKITQALRKAAEKGTSYGLPTWKEVELAQEIRRRFPSMERIRMTSSGTEATMSAIRLARGFTKRERIIKFEGSYHGHVDSLLVRAGSGAATLGTPDSAGVPPSFVATTLSLPYNNAEAFKKVMNEQGETIAVVIVEPVAGNMGVIPPFLEFLKILRTETERHKTLLIFDEVMTGFRVAWGGAQELFGIQPDLTCLGKIVGGGLPVGAFGGRKEIMELLAPLGPVYQAGTLSGNPLAVAAGLATLQELRRPTYKILEKRGAFLQKGIEKKAQEAGIPVICQRVGSMLTVFFSEKPIHNYEEVQQTETQRFARFFNALLDRGVLIPPSAFEAWFLSLAHTESILKNVVEAIGESFQEITQNL